MNTKRRVHGVRGRPKPSMMISTELQKLLKTWLIKYYTWNTYLGSPLLFVHGDAHAESNRSYMEHQSLVPCFLYVAMRMLKVIEA
jgi:hypothetical protein